MKVLITGGAGFIGSNLADKYLDEGWEVFIIDNFSTGERKNLPNKAVIIEGDICLRKTFDDPRLPKTFNVINHNAAHLDAIESSFRVFHDAMTNILGTINVLDFAKKTSAKLIMASTSCVYWGCKEFPVEEDVSRPTLPYGLSKLSAERYVELYSKTKKVPYTILRYGNVYGDRDSKSVTKKFFESVKKEECLLIDGTGEQTRDYIHVSDVVNANMIISSTKSSGVYNVSTGVETSVLDIAKSLAGEGQIKFNLIGDPGVSKCSMSYKKIKEDFGWSPAVSFKQYLRNLKKSL